MPAADQVDVVGHLVAREIEMSRRTGAAEGCESTGHGRDQKEIRNRAVHGGPERCPANGSIRGTAIVTDAINRKVERIERGGRKSVVIADRGGLRQFIVAGRCGQKQVSPETGWRDVAV